MEKNIPFGGKIAQIRQLQGRIAQKIIKQMPDIDVEGINEAQMNIIFQLWLEDNVTISEIAKRTKLANTTLTNMLERLCAMGMIVKSQNESNRRGTIVCLTEKGKKIQDSYINVVKKMRKINFHGFTKEEIDSLFSYLDRVKENLETWERGEE